MLHFVPTAGLVQLLTFAGLPTARRLRSASTEMKEKLDLSLSLLQVALPKQLLLFGGNQGESAAGDLHSSESFDAQREVWSPGFSMRSCRNAASACVYAEHVYICGGVLYGPTELRSVERLSLESGSWERMPRMLRRRSFFAVCVLDDFLYACGGGNEAYMADVEKLQLKPCGDVWEHQAPMHSCRLGLSCLSWHGHLLACGGQDSDDYRDDSDETTAASIEAFVPTGAWKVLTQMPVSRRDMVAGINLDKLYLCGGSMRGDSSSDLLAGERSLLMFDLLAQTWSTLAPMNLKRHAACGAFIGGRLYICGGGDGEEFFESTEVFDPADGSWHQLPAKMQSGRRFAACVTARVLCAVDAEVDGQVAQSAVEKTRRFSRHDFPDDVISHSPDDVNSESSECPFSEDGEEEMCPMCGRNPAADWLGGSECESCFLEHYWIAQQRWPFLCPEGAHDGPCC